MINLIVNKFSKLTNKIFKQFTLILTVTFTIFVSPNLNSSISSICSSVFSPNLKSYQPIKIIDPKNLSKNSISRLSDGVFLFTEPDDGRKYILRVQRENESSHREKFSSLFLSQLANLKTPEIYILDQENSRNIARKLITLGYDEIENGTTFNDFTNIESESFYITLANFVPSESGSDYLSRIKSFFIVDKITFTYINSYLEFKSEFDREMSEDNFRRYWNPERWSQEQKNLKNLTLFIPQLENITYDNALDIIIDHIKNLDISRVEQLRTQLYSFLINDIPSDVQVQISNLWAIYTILGIPDFHPGNWLINKNQVTGIDLTYVFTPPEDSINRVLLEDQLYPYGLSETSYYLSEQLLPTVSLNLKDDLKKISRERILEIAKLSGYSLSEEELKEILLNIEYFIKN